MTEILTVLNSIGYTQFQDCGSHWRTNPLYREYRSQNALAIKKLTGQWFDHSERKGGSLAQLVQKTLHLPTVEETKAYMGDLPIKIDLRESVELTHIKKFDKNILIKLVRDNAYWLGRGISEHIITPFKGGVVNTESRMKGRYTFPIFDDRGDLIGFAGRLLYESETVPKWKILGQKKNFIFPYSALEPIRTSKVAIIVESIGDCLKLLECGIKNVLVSFGVSLSPVLIQELIKLDVDKILIGLNNEEDSFVGNQAAEEYKQELLNYFDAKQVIIALPTAKDFGVMSCPDIYAWKEKHLNENSNG